MCAQIADLKFCRLAEPAETIARECLCSLHVDVLPGDRACDCAGVMKPVFAEPDAKKGYIITHKCTKCGFVGRNKAALAKDGREILPPEQYDDMDLLIRLTVNPEGL